MNKCKSCKKRALVMNFVTVNDGELNTDSYCFPCIISQITSYFGDETLNFIKEYKEIAEKRIEIEERYGAFLFNVKEQMRENMDLMTAKSFTYGINYNSSKSFEELEKEK